VRLISWTLGVVANISLSERPVNLCHFQPNPSRCTVPLNLSKSLLPKTKKEESARRKTRSQGRWRIINDNIHTIQVKYK
jgi:hypothetical protein